MNCVLLKSNALRKSLFICTLLWYIMQPHLKKLLIWILNESLCHQYFCFLPVFTINNVVLHANPAEEVNNGNPVILLCSVDISKSDHFQLNYTFSFLKSDEVLIITTLEQDWAEYKISRARFSDSGEYECMVNVKGKTKTSNSLTVQVKGRF